MAQEGRTNGLTAPGREGQESLLRKAYRAAGVAPGEVHYIEAHGTGTALGDPVEVGALGAVVGEGRTPANPCYIGSLKSNIGHLGMVAGLAGLAKAALALRHRQLPPSLHYTRENPQLGLAEANIAVVDRLMPWPSEERGLTGVTSLSFGGTDIHVILEEAQAAPRRIGSVPAGDPHLLVFSAHDETALRQTAARLAETATGSDGPTLSDLCYTAAVRRSHHAHRAAVVTRSATDLATALEAFAAGGSGGVEHGTADPMRTTRVAFVFPAEQGAWPGTAPRLARSSPVFAETLAACDELMRPSLGYSVAEWPADDVHDDGDGRRRPALFAVQVSLVAMWRALGIEPHHVLGYGVGEVAAAYAAGVLTLEEAAAVVCAGSRVIAETGGEAGSAADALAAMPTDLRPSRTGVPLWSAFTGGVVDGSELGARHWARQLHSPAGSAEIRDLSWDESDTVHLEISPDAASPSERQGPETESWLATLGRFYRLGLPVRFDALYPSGNLVSLPSQAWQRQRYWLPDEAAPPNLAPSRQEEPRVWRFDLDDPETSPLRQHGAEDVAIVPAAAYATLLHHVTGADEGRPPLVLTDLVINRARSLPEPGAGSLVLTVDGDGAAFRFDGDAPGATASTPLATGSLTPGRAGSPRARISPPPEDDTTFLEVLDAAEHDDVMRTRGARYGSAYRLVTEVCRRNGFATGTVRSDLTGPGWVVAAGVLDACLQIAYETLPADDPGGLLPSRIGRLRLHRPLTAGTYQVLASAHDGPTGDEETVVDLDVLADGEPVAEVDGLVLRRLPGQRADATLREHRWRQVVRGRSAAPLAGYGTWVVFADGNGDGDRVAAGLRALAEQVVTVRRGGSVSQAEDGWRTPPTIAGLTALAGELGEVAGIVYLWTADDRPSPDPAVGALAAVDEVIALVRAWAGAGVPRLCVVTRGGVFGGGLPGGGDDLARAPLAALARTIRLEHPGSECVLVDLDPEPNGAESLVDVLGSAAGEPVIAIRSDRWYVPRLVPVDSTAEPPPAAGELTCVITGGLGRLGLLVAERLLDRGVRRVALAGRRAPTPETARRLSALDPSGERISVHRLDVTDPDGVRDLIGRLDRGGPPVGGVVHAAGALDDGVPTAMNTRRLTTVMAPKCSGAWNLHTATLDHDLRFFVVFSSVASVLGSPGQAGYAAANGFLDALAHHRRGAGLPATSIGWGPWEDSPDVAVRGARHWAVRGIAAMSVGESLPAFDRLLDGDETQVAVFRRDDAIGAGVVAAEPAEPAEFEQHEGLEQWLLDQIAEVLGDEADPDRLDAGTAFQDLGLDSLASLELQNRIEARFDLKVPATALWRYPNAVTLSAYLTERVTAPGEVDAALLGEAP